MNGETSQKGTRLKGQNRIRLVGLLFIFAFLAIGAKLYRVALVSGEPEQVAAAPLQDAPLPRPDIVDRNGAILATDLAVASLFADPRKIYDMDEAVESITTQLPELNARTLRTKLTQPGRAFVWLKRQASPEERDAIYNLGIPGVSYVNERRRVYPYGRLAAHAVGYVDVDTKGIAGIEKFLDDQGAIYTASLADPGTNTAAPAQMSIDVRIQHILNDEVSKAITKFHALGGGGIVMDIETGEVLAISSLPDFNPNQEDKSFGKEQQNRMTSGVFELGSVIKAVTFAMALDSGTVSLSSKLDARVPLVIGRARIHDFRAQRRVLTLPEVFTYSSNIGTARMALGVGLEQHLAFLRRVGLMDRLQTELPESAKPLLPRRWGKLASATAAFGHGFAVQPLQGLSVVAGLLNGGNMVPPTFIKRSKAEADALATRIVKPGTSKTMQYLFRLNAEKGSAGKANVTGYRVGGKTGTAEKVVNGRYAPNRNLTSFIGAFPMDSPRYAIFVMLDEPQSLKETYGFATAGWNAVPTAGAIIERIAPILGVTPHFSQEDLAKLEKLAKKKKAGG